MKEKFLILGQDLVELYDFIEKLAHGRSLKKKHAVKKITKDQKTAQYTRVKLEKKELKNQQKHNDSNIVIDLDWIIRRNNPPIYNNKNR